MRFLKVSKVCLAEAQFVRKKARLVNEYGSVKKSLKNWREPLF